ncbi:molybdopterin-binding oxidoreductase [Variovorax sp. dw_308]|uniref:molybdopterin-binding oxidoreductase n=1 Tax=Variovorax sp. dw_308 TaxID=2721546 RepID=UPI001C452266|nr:molybdopterin-binding oxidoreductase [Variovorax sp. dw_308]
MHGSKKWIACAGACAAALLSACGGGGGDSSNAAALVTPVVQVGGAVDHPSGVSLATLAAKPAVTQTVTFNSGTTPQTHTYTGASLWSILGDAGIQNDASRKNDVLSRYALATGSDGYQVIFTLGELSPDFGNKPSILAYLETVSGLNGPLNSSDGPVRVTAPGDVKGGRYVSNLTRLDVFASAATVPGTGGGVSPSFRVSGAVTAPASFDLAALQALPKSSQTIGSSTYTGVSLWALLNTVGLKLPASVKNPTLSAYAVATGSDGYRAAVSLGEIDPGFGAKGALIAYDVNGAGLGANGVARLVIPGEVKQGRLVSNLIAVEVFVAGSAAN